MKTYALPLMIFFVLVVPIMVGQLAGSDSSDSKSKDEHAMKKTPQKPSNRNASRKKGPEHTPDESVQKETDKKSSQQTRAAETSSDAKAAPHEGRTSSSAVHDAVKSEEFVLKDPGNKYELDKPIRLFDPDSSGPKVPVEYQVGTINDKPAFVKVIVDPSQAPKTPEDADKALGITTLPSTVHTAQSDTTMLSCPNGKVCVETQVIDGKEVCVKWQCKYQ